MQLYHAVSQPRRTQSESQNFFTKVSPRNYSIQLWDAPKVQSNMLRVLVITPWYITIHHSQNDVGIPLAKKSDLPQIITSISSDKMTLSSG
jgi:hypothetical protein